MDNELRRVARFYPITLAYLCVVVTIVLALLVLDMTGHLTEVPTNHSSCQ